MLLSFSLSASAAPPSVWTAPPTPSVPIAPGVALPIVSLGTGSGQHGDVAAATEMWLTNGGRGIDTAYMYHDETKIAAGVAASGASDVFLTTKVLCGTKHSVRKQVASNLADLKVGVVDLLLIHFPECEGFGSVADTWSVLEEARASGQARAIGVSNFKQAQLEKLAKTATVWPPAVNQCSMSVSFHDAATAAYCDAHGIVYEAFSPLCGGSNGSSCSHGSVLTIPLVKRIAAAHGVSAAQVGLKWIVQQGRPLTTAVWRADYMKEDLDLWSWGNLTAGEMKELSAYALAYAGRSEAAAGRGGGEDVVHPVEEGAYEA